MIGNAEGGRDQVGSGHAETAEKADEEETFGKFKASERIEPER